MGVSFIESSIVSEQDAKALAKDLLQSTVYRQFERIHEPKKCKKQKIQFSYDSKFGIGVFAANDLPAGVVIAEYAG